jgi:hypothetical protein
MRLALDTGLLLVGLCGLGSGLGLMAVIDKVISWDTARRNAEETRKLMAERRQAAQRAAASQPPARGAQPRPARPGSRPAGPPSPPPSRPQDPWQDPWQETDQYHPRRARPASSTEGLPFLADNSQQGSEWIPAPVPVNGQPARPYVRMGY